MKYILLLVLLIASCQPALASQQNDKRLIDAAYKAASLACLGAEDYNLCAYVFKSSFIKAYKDSYK